MKEWLRKSFIKKIWDALTRFKRRLLSTIAPKYETQKLYEANFGYKNSYTNPVTINEKLQCLKFGEYYNNPIITKCIDKYRIREYLIEKNLSELIPELYGVYDAPQEINWNELPNQFVIKCNHGSGYNILCNDKSKINVEECKKKLCRWMKEEYWKEYCEVQYKFIQKKIIVEQYLGDNIYTYKLYCYHGKPKVVYVSLNGENGEQDKYIDFFDMEWNHLEVGLRRHLHYPEPEKIQKPDSFERMKQIAEILSNDFPFVRVDLYDINGKVYISELTFIPTGGLMKLEPAGTDKRWGDWLTI